jgi:hypothetical protein
VKADGDMKQVTGLLDAKYGDHQPEKSWFGHPARPENASGGAAGPDRAADAEKPE